MRKLFYGPGPKKLIPRQGPWRVHELLLEQWNRDDSHGALRLFSLLLTLSLYVRPLTYIDWIVSPQKGEMDARTITMVREMFYVLRIVFWFAVLIAGIHDNSVVAVVVVVLLLDMVRSPVGHLLVWGHHSIGTAKSVVWAVINYGELALGFAILYRHFDLAFKEFSSWLHAVYFSVITSATVGYGELRPVEDLGYALVVIHVTLSIIYFVLIFAGLLNQMPKIDKIVDRNLTKASSRRSRLSRPRRRRGRANRLRS